MIKKLLSMTEQELYRHIRNTIPCIAAPDYLVTDFHRIPVPMICVHLDTVSLYPPKLFKCEHGIITAPGSVCLGADDRAGVWIALEMIKQGTLTPFEYGFFMGEEIGGIGSGAYADTKPNHTCYIGLDRASKGGKQNLATYGYDSQELIDCFPYPESYGTMSDCSVLADATNTPCVNLSVGYDFEHTPKEQLNIAQMIETLNVMLNINIPEIEYSKAICCDMCGEHLPLYDKNGLILCRGCLYYDY